ncbi:MAG: F0F1 ATP synthase subunit epsilon [Myxococcota bacterium]|jgi:F-type H+-transporting ATPase subunit epsilon|nr:F0F1 ATP synthase subunit epsilon [Myxococcota bacterium]
MSESGLLVEVVSPDQLELSTTVDSIVIPASLGEMEVLPGHIPLLTMAKPGVLVVRRDGEDHHYAISAGFVEVLPDRVTVLVDAAEDEDEIDIERAKAALMRAEDRLASVETQDVEQRFAFESALERARARIAVWQHRQQHSDHDD